MLFTFSDCYRYLTKENQTQIFAAFYVLDLKLPSNEKQTLDVKESYDSISLQIGLPSPAPGSRSPRLFGKVHLFAIRTFWYFILLWSPSILPPFQTVKVCMRVLPYMYVQHEPAWCPASSEGMLDKLELEWLTVPTIAWVLRLECRSSAEATGALTGHDPCN